VTAALSGVAIGALLGSVPFAWLLHRVATGRDLRDEGSGNPGAANLERSGGKAWAAAALALDAGKGAAAVLVARYAFGETAGVPAALGAVLSHVFTPWLAGRGGKGVATTMGAFAVLAPIATAAAIAVFSLVVAVTRLVSLGSVLGAAALPIAIAVYGPHERVAAAAAAIFLLIAWRHRGNFARMRAGTEPRLGGRASDRGGAAR
jgi:acyl phosphate:glycerol-3-phosphate acyltransferase